MKNTALYYILVSSYGYKGSHLVLTYYLYSTGVKLNFFLGWPIGPAKIWFGWPAISLVGPRYFYRSWSADNNYHILRNRN